MLPFVSSMLLFQYSEGGPCPFDLLSRSIPPIQAIVTDETCVQHLDNAHQDWCYAVTPVT